MRGWRLGKLIARYLGWCMEQAGFVLMSAAIFIFGFLQGLHQTVLRLDLVLIGLTLYWVNSVATSAMFTGFIAVTGLLMLSRKIWRRDTDRQFGGDTVTAIVPVHRDAAVLERSVLSLLRSRYEDLRVVIVCEPGDEASIERAMELSRHLGVSFIVNQEPGSKAAAINDAVRRTSSRYVGVFDADHVVDPMFIPHAVARLEDGYEVVSGHDIPQPDGWIESLAYYEKVLFQFGRNLQRLIGFADASSSMVVMERSTLERLGGYSADTLTEDVDFTHTCYTEGVDVLDTYRFPARSEAAHTLRDVWGQRKRWVMGRLMVAAKEVTSFLSSPGVRSGVSAFMAVSSIAGSLFMLTLVAKFAVLFLFGAQVFYTVPLTVFVAAVVTMRVLDTWRGHVDRVGPDWLVAPFLFPFYSLITAKSLFEYLRTSSPTWYRVEKGV